MRARFVSLKDAEEDVKEKDSFLDLLDLMDFRDDLKYK